MSHSNTSLNCFASCMKKYEHMYILHTPSDLPPTPHIEFGIMAHDVLYRIGMARDFDENGLALAEHFEKIVPSELLYPELKEYFKINSWHDYFKAVCQQVIAYELQLVKEMNCPVEIKRELRMQLTVDQLKEQVRPEATTRIQSSLVLEQIAKEENIEISDEEVDAEVEKMAAAYGMEADKLKEYMGEAEKKSMKSDLAITKAVELIMENVKERAKAKSKKEKDAEASTEE